MSLYQFVYDVIGNSTAVDSEKFCLITACCLLVLLVITINKIILSFFGGK